MPQLDAKGLPSLTQSLMLLETTCPLLQDAKLGKLSDYIEHTDISLHGFFNPCPSTH